MILITGSQGFIGTKLSEYFPDAFGVDIKTGENLLSCSLPEVNLIYHLAAQTSVEASWEDPVTDSYNISMVARLVKEYPNARIIYTDSAASLDRQSPYGFSKWAAAQYLKQFHQNYVICQLPNVYGPGSHSVVDIFKNNIEITLYGEGKNIRDYVHVEDIVNGILKAAFWEKGEYQLGTGKGTAVRDLLRPHHKVTYAPARKESPRSVLKNTTPNWEPQMTLKDYL